LNSFLNSPRFAAFRSARGCLAGRSLVSGIEIEKPSENGQRRQT
jgi:hypothetical protein